MPKHQQLVAILATIGLLVLVFDLVRRRRLLERYALVWMAVTAALLLLSAWGDLLDKVAGAIGVSYPPSALFAAAFGFVIVLLLHFSVAVSRLSDQSKMLAQRLALLEEQMRRNEQREATLDDAREAQSPAPVGGSDR
jgi:hypothetical protein